MPGISCSRLDGDPCGPEGALSRHEPPQKATARVPALKPRAWQVSSHLQAQKGPPPSLSPPAPVPPQPPPPPPHVPMFFTFASLSIHLSSRPLPRAGRHTRFLLGTRQRAKRGLTIISHPSELSKQPKTLSIIFKLACSHDRYYLCVHYVANLGVGFSLAPIKSAGRG